MFLGSSLVTGSGLFLGSYVQNRKRVPRAFESNLGVFAKGPCQNGYDLFGGKDTSLELRSFAAAAAAMTVAESTLGLAGKLGI